MKCTTSWSVLSILYKDIWYWDTYHNSPQTFNALKSTSFQVSQIISDLFSPLFLTYALTPLAKLLKVLCNALLNNSSILSSNFKLMTLYTYWTLNTIWCYNLSLFTPLSVTVETRVIDAIFIHRLGFIFVYKNQVIGRSIRQYSYTYILHAFLWNPIV